MNLFRFSCVSLLVAGALSAQTLKPKVHGDECGPLAKQVLKCPKYGFTYQVIFGWVDRTGDMQQDEALPDQSTGEKSSNPAPSNPNLQPASSKAAKTLLAAFERPPGAPGDTINSAVVIAAEPLANYQGINSAADYFSPITELAEQRGFKVVKQPHTFASGAKQLVRGDYSKERGKLTMWQTSLATIEKGYIVSFTFIGGSEDEVDELIGNLVFSPRATAKPPKERETK